jgi:tellurite resistance protein TehA-like permease
MAALTLATFRFFELSGNDMFRLAGLALYGLLALIIAILIINTLLAMAGRKICVPE